MCIGWKWGIYITLHYGVFFTCCLFFILFFLIHQLSLKGTAAAKWEEGGDCNIYGTFRWDVYKDGYGYKHTWVTFFIHASCITIKVFYYTSLD